MSATDNTPPRPGARTGLPKPIVVFLAAEDRAFLSHRLPMARAAGAAGFAVHVVTKEGVGRAAIEAEGFAFHPVPMRRGLTSPWSTLRSIAALRRLYRHLQPALVHHSGLQPSVIGAIAAMGSKCAVVNAMTGMGYIFTSSSWRARMMQSVVGLVARCCMNGPRSVALVQNPDDWNALVQLGIKAGRIALIPGSGVDTLALQPLPEPAEPITVGFAGRLLADKGIRALIEATALVRARGVDLRLLIAGTTDPANPASIPDREVEDWTRLPGVTLMGHVQDIGELWRQSHIAVLPSHREGLPKALMEAAACGRPMIATDVPGCREIVIRNQTGLLVPVDDPPALAEAILHLAQDPALRARLGAAARAKVEREMSERAVGNATVELYRRALAMH